MWGEKKKKHLFIYLLFWSIYQNCQNQATVKRQAAAMGVAQKRKVVKLFRLCCLEAAGPLSQTRHSSQTQAVSFMNMNKNASCLHASASKMLLYSDQVWWFAPVLHGGPCAHAVSLDGIKQSYFVHAAGCHFLAGSQHRVHAQSVQRTRSKHMMGVLLCKKR